MSGPTPSFGSLSGQNIRICCRIRPVAIGVEEETSGTVVYQHSHKSLHLLDPRHKGVSREFAFDRVYCQEHTEEVFREEICDHIPGLFCGHHLTVFAHGASGSGKTFTMEGAEPPGDYGGLGITPQSVAMIFWHMEHQLSEAERGLFEVKFSLYEIYCEKVRDLLQDVGGCNKEGSLGIFGGGGGESKYDLADLPIQN